MIDIKKAEEEFKKYLDNFDINNEKIALKKAHTFRVEENSKIIAKSLNLEQEDEELAILIGLLHDIGRFEQVKRYNSFNDIETEDHGDLGVEILQKNNYIENFAGRKYWDTIFKAVKNHNKLEIEKGLDDKDLMHAKIVRDADKLDIIIMYIERVNDLYEENKVKNIRIEPFINPKIIEELKNKNMIKKSDKKFYGDGYVGAIGFLYDINYSKTLEILKENDYINKLLDGIKLNCSLEEQDWIEQIRELANGEISKRLSKEG